MFSGVSVIMCSYNGLPFIKDAVKSVMEQTYMDWELIISDDGSTDGTREWLQEAYGNHPKVRLFFQEKNLGYVANKNFAHQQASGIYLTQLDNDDLMAPDKLELQMSAAGDGYKMVSCGFHKIDVDGRVYDTITDKEIDIFKRHTTEGYPFWFPSLLVHKEVFEQQGYFNEYFARALGDDVYWTMKVNQQYTIHHLEQVLYSYRSNPGSITSDYRNVRKLLLPEVINRLSKQQQEQGVDWLEQGKLEQLAALEKEILDDHKFMAGKYRMCAAVAMDAGKKKEAVQLLWKAIKKAPFSLASYRTGMYILRR